MSKEILLKKTRPGPSGAGPKISLHRYHRWGGMIAGLWLLVLGLTGFILDHRDWRWVWQTTVPEWMATGETLEKSRGGGIALYRVDPEYPGRRIVGGKLGLWTSSESNAPWYRTQFVGAEGNPQVFSIVEDEVGGWKKIWLATDDGVWVSKDYGVSAEKYALEGEIVTAMGLGNLPGELFAVLDKSRAVSLNTSDEKVTPLEFAGVKSEQLVESVSLSRFVHDLHFGRGLFNGLSSILINDLGGIAMVVLPLTGFVFWLLPRRWKKIPSSGKKSSTSRRRGWMKTLYHTHGTAIGIISVIPVIYLSVTGILIDHRAELMDWMKGTSVRQSWLPPVYDLKEWDGEVYGIAGYPGEKEKISVGSRVGLFTTEDRGKSWVREALPGPQSVFAWTVKRAGDSLFIGGMGSPNYRKAKEGEWQIVKGVGHMPSDVAPLPEGGFVWKSHKGILASKADGRIERIEETLPAVDGVPLFYILDGLHSGLIFHEQWKWINDIVSLLAIFLTVSGLIRLWRRARFFPEPGFLKRSAKSDSINLLPAENGAGERG